MEAHADTEDTADNLAEAVLGALLGLTESTHDEVAVQGVLDWGIASALDGAWTPPKPHRIVTVTLTVRAK